jgi:hypothetical protein
MSWAYILPPTGFAGYFVTNHILLPGPIVEGNMVMNGASGPIVIHPSEAKG